MKKIYLSLILLVIGIQSCFCQTILEGIILQEYIPANFSVPTSGITVLLKNTSIGTVTDSEGQFSISVPDSIMDEEIILVISAIGYTNVEAKIHLTNDIHRVRIELIDNEVKVEVEKLVGSALLDTKGISTVYFATDRNFVKTEDPWEMFGVNRSPNLSYGYCRVSIPIDHRMGELESPNIWKLELNFDPNKHIVLLETKVNKKSDYFKMLRDSIEKSTEKKAFIFIHGYNVSFADAARRTAQMSYDLGFTGVPVFYSWPSKASTLKYTVDEATIEWTQLHLKSFLIDFLSQTNVQNIYVIAHSMGNRAMTRAIASLINEKPQLAKKIKEIILAAPDIDADVFKQEIVPSLTKGKHPITLYASSDDLALKASKAVHGAPRAGDSGNKLLVVKGVESIDATGMDTGFLQHSYIGDSRTVISDVYSLFKGLRPNERNLLRIKKTSNLFYWKFRL
ncbi:alpha/beta hydrolase [Adhaeribacter rhizoryzae]|uniref:Alpha/beta hydrolase n=1 Tax=Adhaeribacter rhizoryzae TaxID=2607907 RepID=A0A5M6DJT3_9BACT|nr:alpha/beta hydrolase [Adhaeribacter rhizoryzae]KAA5547817.1 alpha/beta hydrolase [Adhaeribacter rhizoryzae]